VSARHYSHRSIAALVTSLAFLCLAPGSQAHAQELGEAPAGGWLQAQELAAPQLCGNCHYGGWVAVQGSTAVVTEPDEEKSGGYAYVYERLSSGEWVERARLEAPAGTPPYSFGQSVGISGSTLVISAWERNEQKGVAYVYERSPDGAWSHKPTAKLKGSGEEGEAFSYSVAIEGSTIVAGAPDYDEGRGAAYVFERSEAGEWSRQAIFTVTGGKPGDSLGLSVALSGSTIIAGAPREPLLAGPDEPSAPALDENGVAYVFTRSAGGTWSKTPTATLKGPAEALHEGYGNWFGDSVALRGSTALIGALAAGGSKPPGAAFVFTRSAGGAWSTEPVELMAKNAEAEETFGFAVALSGSTAIVGAYGHHKGTGAAYVFEPSEAGEWSQQAKLVATNRAEGADFGLSVALSGTTAFVGADEAKEGGRAYVFTRP
jgi:FG-GAP repeat